MRAYQDKDWLYRKYLEQRLSTGEIAKLCDTSRMTISRWLKRHGITARSLEEAMKKREEVSFKDIQQFLRDDPF